MALALSACGGGTPAAPEVNQPAEPEGASAATVPEQARAPVGAPSCGAQLGGFLDSMDGLRDRLVAGVSYPQYIDEMKAVRAAYEDVPVDQLRIDCLRRAGTPAEEGFNLYIVAANVWSDCVEVPGCEAVSVEAALQRRWRRASKLVSDAEAGLSGR